MSVWDLRWPFEQRDDGTLRRLPAPLDVTLDEEGYATFCALKETLGLEPGARIELGDADRDAVLGEMDVLVRFYVEFPGVRMVPPAFADGQVRPAVAQGSLFAPPAGAS